MIEQKTQRLNTQTFKHSNKCVYVFMCLCVWVFATITVHAAINLDASGALGTAAQQAKYNPRTDETTLAATVGKIISVILTSMGVFFMILMIYAGYLWMNARGEETQIEKAQTIIRGSIIGLIIVMGAYAITNFVVPKVLERTVGPGGGAPTVGTRTQ